LRPESALATGATAWVGGSKLFSPASAALTPNKRRQTNNFEGILLKESIPRSLFLALGLAMAILLVENRASRSALWAPSECRTVKPQVGPNKVGVLVGSDKQSTLTAFQETRGSRT